MPFKDKEKHREFQRKWAAEKIRRETPEERAKRLERKRKYRKRNLKKIKAYTKKYNAKPKTKELKRRYERNPRRREYKRAIKYVERYGEYAEACFLLNLKQKGMRDGTIEGQSIEVKLREFEKRIMDFLTRRRVGKDYDSKG